MFRYNPKANYQSNGGGYRQVQSGYYQSNGGGYLQVLCFSMKHENLNRSSQFRAELIITQNSDAC